MLPIETSASSGPDGPQGVVVPDVGGQRDLGRAQRRVDQRRDHQQPAQRQRDRSGPRRERVVAGELPVPGWAGNGLPGLDGRGVSGLPGRGG